MPTRPHVIIVDLSIKTASLGGLSFVRRLRLHDKKTPILVLSMHSDPMIIRRALEAGATGYVLKDAPAEEFLRAFQAVRQGKPYLSHEVASEIAFSETLAASSPLQSLTVRELQTLALISEGKSYGDIADELSISYKTVANTTSQIKNKLGARSLPELMRIAIQHLPAPSRRRGLRLANKARGVPLAFSSSDFTSAGGLMSMIRRHTEGAVEQPLV